LAREETGLASGDGSDGGRAGRAGRAICRRPAGWRQKYAELNLLNAVGEQPKTVLLKRGMSATLEEFLLACRIHHGQGESERDALRARHPHV